MKNMDKGLTVPKWVLTNRPKINQKPKNVLAQDHKFGIFKLSQLWVSVVRNYYVCIGWYSSAAESTDTMKSKHYLEFEFKVMHSNWTLNKTKSMLLQSETSKS